jgi:O-antigen/teichoic acid export membrane protein
MLKNIDQNTQSHVFIKTVARYSSSHFYRKALGLLNSLIKPKLLNPEFYGLWSFLSLISQYALFGHLGSREAMRYMIPHHQSRKEADEIPKIVGSTFYLSMAMALATAAGLVIFSFVKNIPVVERWGLITVAAVIILECLMYHNLNYFKGMQEFNLVSNSLFLDATFTFVTGVVFIYFFNIYGVYISAVLSTCMTVLYTFRIERFPRHIRFSVNQLKNLIKLGFPLTFMNFISMILYSVDRIIIINFLGIKELGYYSISLIVVEFIMHIPSASREILEPKIIENLVHESEENILTNFLLRPLINTSFYIPLLIGCVFFLLPIVLPSLLPAYSLGLVPSQIALYTAYFISLIFITRGLIVAYRLQYAACIISIIVIIFNVILSIVAAKSGLGLEGIACSSAIAQCLHLLLLLGLIRKHCASSFAKIRRKLSLPLYPFFAMTLLFLALSYLQAIWQFSIFLENIICLLIFLTVMLSIIYISSRYSDNIALLRFKDFR